MRDGIPIHPEELGFESNPEVYQENHHMAFQRKKLAKFVITQTFRDLNTMQTPIPVDPHRQLHARYDQPEIEIQAAYEYVWQAYEHMEQLRFGSVKNVQYRDITAEDMAKVEQEHEKMKYILNRTRVYVL